MWPDRPPLGLEVVVASYAGDVVSTEFFDPRLLLQTTTWARRARINTDGPPLTHTITVTEVPVSEMTIDELQSASQDLKDLEKVFVEAAIERVCDRLLDGTLTLAQGIEALHALFSLPPGWTASTPLGQALQSATETTETPDTGCFPN